MEKTARRKATLHFAAVAMASVMSLFVVTNGVAYAVTGETWVEKAIVIVNGEPMEVDVATSERDGKEIQSTEFMVGETSVLLEAEDLSDIELGFSDELLGADKSYHAWVTE